MVGKRSLLAFCFVFIFLTSNGALAKRPKRPNAENENIEKNQDIVQFATHVDHDHVYDHKSDWNSPENFETKKVGTYGKIPNKNQLTDDIETLPYNVIESNDDYEVRRYPASKWICTQQIEDLADDFFINWRQRFNSGKDAWLAYMRNKRKGSNNTMFNKLFKYILGVNADAVEIKMTRPVTRKRLPLGGNKEKQEMCFWTGSPWKDQTLPRPIKDDVYVQHREPEDVFVMTFKEYLLSPKDWEGALEKLADKLVQRSDVDTSGWYYTVGYNSPFDEESKLHNEVWIAKSVKDQTNVHGQPAADLFKLGHYETWDDISEAIDYQVLETYKDFEVRRYPSSKWVCTTEQQVDPQSDPLNDWQTKFNNNTLDVLSSTVWKDTATGNMFMRLLRYMVGVNLNNAALDFTKPVSIRVSENMEEQMCFWLGSKYQARLPPTPMDSRVEVIMMNERTVFVRKFGGYAFSHGDFEVEHANLKIDLGNRLNRMSGYYAVSYNSPFTTEDRHNEVWIEER